MDDATKIEPAMDPPNGPTAQSQGDDGWEWATVEIMGHRSHAGRTREVEKFGQKFLRVDVPIDGDPIKGWRTHLYSGASIFSFSLCTEEVALKANRPYVSPYRLQAITQDVRDAVSSQVDPSDEDEESPF
jgi:hypothetical protein